MKRHLVMDLFYGKHSQIENSPWKDVKKEIPKDAQCKVRVKFPDNSEKDAYFYHDGCGWIATYGLKSCAFWDCISKEALHQVTHWKKYEEGNE